MDFRYAPPPPPPLSSSDPHRPPPPQPQQPIPPHPGAYYSSQFQYPSPSPPQQWGPQPPPPPPPPPHHYTPGPPQQMPYASNNYSLPPRPHLHPQQPHYPPVNQEWSNSGWGHPGFDYSVQNKNDDDWEARAKAWAAKKHLTEDRHHSQLPPANRPEEMNYHDQYPQNVEPPYQEFQQRSLPLSNYQQYSSFAPQPRPPANHMQEPMSFSSGYGSDGQFSYSARDGNLRDSAAAYPHQETAPTSLSVHQQEVPSSYSSVAGKDGSRDMNGIFYQQSHTPFASASQHQVQPSLSSNDRPYTIEQQPQYAFNNSSVELPTDLSNQPLDFGPRYSHDYGQFGQSGPPGMPFSSMPPVHPTGQQADPSVGVPSPASMHSTPLFGGISNTSFPIGTSNAFHGDTYGTPGYLDRPKKASVPNWLREEIIKKKAVIESSVQELSRHDTEFNEDEEVMDRSFGKGDQRDGNSMDSTGSKEEDNDDDEDDVELARTVAMNAEIKRLLTDVLLKVTDELFDEIATKVLDEDDLNVEVERKAITSSDTLSAVITPKSSAKVLIPTQTKGIDSPGDVLGLGNYASDDDDEEEKEVQNLSIQSSNSSKPFVPQGENGSSRENLLEEERDSHVVSPKRAMGNDISGEVKVKPGSVGLSKSKQSVPVEDSLPDDSQVKLPRNGQDKIHMKVDEKSRVHDEKYAKSAKKEDQNGSKEKIKERDPGKQVSKTEVKDDKKDIDRDRRSREKEDSRKRERGKDEKNERSKYKSDGDSSKHKRRHRAPSPGGRGRGSKDRLAHRSSDSSSSDSRRKVRSRRRDSSPSPVRSRRLVSRSRSPPSKHFHRRHSNYSSLETTRERKRSRSRSRSRSRRG